MYCHNCGEELSPSASFCLKCGTLRSQIEQGFSAPTATEETSAEEQAFLSLTNKNLTIERTLSLVFGIAYSLISSLMMLPLSFLLLATASDAAYTFLAESIMLLAVGVVSLINVFSINKVRGCLYSNIKPAQKRYKSGVRSVIMFIFCTGPWVLHIINQKRFEACSNVVESIAAKQRNGVFENREA